MGKKLTNLLTTAAICVIFAISVTAQDAKPKGDIIHLGKMSGLTWYMDTSFITPTKIKTFIVITHADWKEGQLYVFNELDCFDKTIRIHSSIYFVNDRKVSEVKKKSPWGNVDGIGIPMAKYICDSKRVFTDRSEVRFD